MVYDYTSLSCFQTCRKKFYYFAIRHLQPKKKEAPIAFGIAIHNALDIFYTEGLDSVVKQFKETYVDFEEDDIRTKANGVLLLETYAEKYKNEPFKIVGKPEGAFTFKIDDIDYVGKIDLPVEWDGQLWIMEHKTTASMRSNFFDQFMLDKQLIGYILAVEAYMGKECTGSVINALEVWKPVQKVSAKTKAPFDHFARCPITKSKEAKENFKLNVKRIVRDIEWCKENDEWYGTECKHACIFYFKKCPYFDLCFYGENERTLKNFEVREWNPAKEQEDASV